MYTYIYIYIFYILNIQTDHNLLTVKLPPDCKADVWFRLAFREPLRGSPISPMWVQTFNYISFFILGIRFRLAFALVNHLGTILAPSWQHLGPSWHHLGSILAASWQHLGSSCNHLGTILAASWSIFGPSWIHLATILAPSWQHLGPSWGHLGSSFISFLCSYLSFILYIYIYIYIKSYLISYDVLYNISHLMFFQVSFILYLTSYVILSYI